VDIKVIVLVDLVDLVVEDLVDLNNQDSTQDQEILLLDMDQVVVDLLVALELEVALLELMVS